MMDEEFKGYVKASLESLHEKVDRTNGRVDKAHGRIDSVQKSVESLNLTRADAVGTARGAIWAAGAFGGLVGFIGSVLGLKMGGK